MDKKDKGSNKVFCPKCDAPIFPFIGFSAGMIYECKKCGYRGPLALKKTKNPAKLK